MTRRRKTQITIVLVAVLGGMAWLILRLPAEPNYQGKSLSFWLAQYRDPSRNTVTEQIWGKKVDDAIRHIGTNAFPVLLRMLQAKDSRIKSKLANFLNQQHFIKVHITMAEEQKWMAIAGFTTLGADGRGAIPELAKLFAGTASANRLEIGEALARILPARDRELYFNTSDRIYVLSRDDLLRELGPATILHENWAAYDMGDILRTGRKLQIYLCIEFSTNRILDSVVIGSPSTNLPPPFIDAK